MSSALTAATERPVSASRMNEIPSTPLASSPELLARKNVTGNRIRRSHSASWAPFSTRPSILSRCRFCATVASAARTAATMSAAGNSRSSLVDDRFRAICPSTSPVTSGTASPRQAAISPATSRPRTSPDTPAIASLKTEPIPAPAGIGT